MPLTPARLLTPTRLARVVFMHRFEALEPFYAEGDCTPSITTFLGETCCLKSGGCHPSRITVQLPEPVTEYTIAAMLARSSADPGTDCTETSFCIHDGSGNGYEYDVNEYQQKIKFWRDPLYDFE